MIDLVERIGPVLGVVAFLGLAILAFLIFQQAREVRRLREWAGRAPERAAEAAEAVAAAAEARGEVAAAERGERGRGQGAWAGVRERFAGGWEAVDRSSPIDPRYIVAVLAAALVAVAVLTSGFGLVGGGDEGRDGRRGGGGGGQKQRAERERKIEVAVINATQILDPETGVEIGAIPGVASTVARELVRPAGFRPGVETNAPAGFEDSVVMFERGEQEAAERLARAVESELGRTPVEPMSDEIAAVAEGAPLALVIGADDGEAFGDGESPDAGDE